MGPTAPHRARPLPQRRSLRRRGAVARTVAEQAGCPAPAGWPALGHWWPLQAPDAQCGPTAAGLLLVRRLNGVLVPPRRAELWADGRRRPRPRSAGARPTADPPRTTWRNSLGPVVLTASATTGSIGLLLGRRGPWPTVAALVDPTVRHRLAPDLVGMATSSVLHGPPGPRRPATVPLSLRRFGPHRPGPTSSAGARDQVQPGRRWIRSCTRRICERRVSPRRRVVVDAPGRPSPPGRTTTRGRLGRGPNR